MSYLRVIPRDLFNEANLLKCIGRLTLLIHDGKLPGWSFEHEDYFDDGFIIEQNGHDGSLYLRSIDFFYKGHLVTFSRPMNSRQPYPLVEDTTGEFIFDDKGNFIFNIEAIKLEVKG